MTTWTDTPPPDGPWEAKHHPEGSVVQPVGSDQSIFAKSNGTPCVSRATANLIVAAVNAYRANPDQ